MESLMGDIVWVINIIQYTYPAVLNIALPGVAARPLY